MDKDACNTSTRGWASMFIGMPMRMCASCASSLYEQMLLPGGVTNSGDRVHSDGLEAATADSNRG